MKCPLKSVECCETEACKEKCVGTGFSPLTVIAILSIAIALGLSIRWAVFYVTGK